MCRVYVATCIRRSAHGGSDVGCVFFRYRGSISCTTGECPAEALVPTVPGNSCRRAPGLTASLATCGWGQINCSMMFHAMLCEDRLSVTIASREGMNHKLPIRTKLSLEQRHFKARVGAPAALLSRRTAFERVSAKCCAL